MEAVNRLKLQLSVRDFWIITALCALGMLVTIKQQQLAKAQAENLELANKLGRQAPLLPTIGVSHRPFGTLIDTKIGEIVYFLRLQLLNGEGAVVTSSLTMVEVR